MSSKHDAPFKKKALEISQRDRKNKNSLAIDIRSNSVQRRTNYDSNRKFDSQINFLPKVFRNTQLISHKTDGGSQPFADSKRFTKVNNLNMRSTDTGSSSFRLNSDQPR